MDITSICHQRMKEFINSSIITDKTWKWIAHIRDISLLEGHSRVNSLRLLHDSFFAASDRQARDKICLQKNRPPMIWYCLPCCFCKMRSEV